MTMHLTNQKSADVDVLILGGGTAGCAAALALANQDAGLRIAIVAAAQPAARRIGESLPPQSAQLLRQLGAWDAFVADEHQPCPGFSACWGNPDPGYIDFFTLPHGPGWTLDRNQFDRTLSRSAAQAGAQIFRNSRAVNLSRNVDGTTSVGYRIENRRASCRARFVLDATGRRSWVARHTGVFRQHYDQLIMLSALVPRQAVTASHPMTLIEATEFGWWYSTGLPDGHRLIGFFTDSDIARQLQLYDPRRWQLHLKQTRHTKQQGVTDHGLPRIKVSAAMSYQPHIRHGRSWLAIGDAAGTCDPLSAQGIYKALRDGIQAADAAYQSLAHNSTESVPAHAQRQSEQYERYLHQRSHYYAQETRWSNSEFWRRRYRDGKSTLPA